MIWNETSVVCLYRVFRQTPCKTEKIIVVRQKFNQWISYLAVREISGIRSDVHQSYYRSIVRDSLDELMY